MTTVKDKLSKLISQRDKVDQEMAKAKMEASIEEHSRLMGERAEIEKQASVELGQMFTAKKQAEATARRLQSESEAAWRAFLDAQVRYAQLGQHWQARVGELDAQIRDTRPPELVEFLGWIQEYRDALGGAYTYGSPFMDRQHELVPMAECKNLDGGYSAIVDHEALAQTRELLAGSRERAQQLAVIASPETFAKDLSKLRAEVEAELTRLRG